MSFRCICMHLVHNPHRFATFGFYFPLIGTIPSPSESHVSWLALRPGPLAASSRATWLVHPGEGRAEERGAAPTAEALLRQATPSRGLLLACFSGPKPC